MTEDRLLRMVYLIVFVLTIVPAIYIGSQAVVVDPDSGFEFTNAQRLVLGGDPEPGPVLQQYGNAVVLLVFDFDYASILAVQCLLTALIFVVISVLARESGDRYAGLFALASLLPLQVAFFGPSTLKQYPLFLLFLLLSLLYFYRFTKSGGRRTLILSGLFMAAASITHLLALPFVSVVIVYYLVSRVKSNNRGSLRNLVLFCLVVLALLLPYLAWRASLGSLSLDSVTTYPSSWMTLKYGKIINEEFWGFTPSLTLGYFQDLFKLLVGYAFLPLFLPFIILGLVTCCHKVFYLSWLFLLLAPYLAGRGVLSWVYTYPFFPFAVILVALGLREFTKWRLRRSLIATVLVVFLVFAAYGLSTTITAYEQRFGNLMEVEDDAFKMEDIVPTGVNILSRSRGLSNLLPQRVVFGLGDLSEEDAILYLNWTSDSIVGDVFDKYGLSFVIMHKEVGYERDYHVWFEHLMGHKPRHYYMIEESSYFRLRYDGNKFKLYEFIR